MYKTNLFVGVKVKDLSMGGSTSLSESSDSKEMTMGMDKSLHTLTSIFVMCCLLEYACANRSQESRPVQSMVHSSPFQSPESSFYTYPQVLSFSLASDPLRGKCKTWTLDWTGLMDWNLD